jgi:hypothetical protein
MIPSLHITLPEQTFTGWMELHGTLRGVSLRAVEGDPSGACTLLLQEEGILFAGDTPMPDEKFLRVVPGRNAAG